MMKTRETKEAKEAIETKEARGTNIADALLTLDDNVLFHVFFALTTEYIAKQLPDFDALIQHQDNTAQMLERYLLDSTWLTYSLECCNQDYDVLWDAMDRYTEDHGYLPTAFLDLELVLDTLPSYYSLTVDTDLRNELFNSMSVLRDYIEIPAIGNLLPDLHKELEPIAEQLRKQEEQEEREEEQ